MLGLGASAWLSAALSLGVPGDRPPEQWTVLFADLGRAVAASRAGAALARELEERVAQIDRRVAEREGALAELRAPTRRELRSRSEALVLAGEQALAEEEAALAALQERTLSPLFADLRRRLREEERRGYRLLILEESAHRPVAPHPGCDATAWLTRALDAPDQLEPLIAPGACRHRFLLTVNLTAFAGAMERTRATKQALREIERERERPIVDPDLPASRLELYRLFSAREVERRARADRERRLLTLAARAFVLRTMKRLPGVLFLERGPGALRAPSCEVTSWLSGLEARRAELSDLGAACPCVWFSRGERLRIARTCPVDQETGPAAIAQH